MATFAGNEVVGTSSVSMYKQDETNKPYTGYSKIYGEARTYIHVNDKYFNYGTGHVYVCTEPGLYMSDAYRKQNNRNDQCKWRYDHTEILKSPVATVQGLTLARNKNGSRVMTASWKNPSWATQSTANERAEALTAVVTLETSNGNVTRTLTQGGLPTSVTYNLSGNVGGLTYKRADWYPLTAKKLTATSVCVYYTNTKTKLLIPSSGSSSTGSLSGSTNKTGTGAQVSVRKAFSKPRKPTISAITQNMDTGVLSCTIKTDPGEDLQERYDTKYKVTYRAVDGTITTTTKSSTSTSFNVTQDVPERQSIAYNQYVRVTVEAWARGYAGDSDHVSRTYYVSFPNAPKISSVEGSGRTVGTRVVAKIDTAKTTEHPVTGVRLQRIVSCEYKTASQIPANVGGEDVWEDTDAVDNGACTALSLPYEDLVPLPGTYTWVRVKSWYGTEDGIFVRYSAPFRVRELETPAPTVADDDIAIYSLTSTADGTGAEVELLWEPLDGPQDDSNACELSWSEDADTWKSTESPDTFVLEDSVWGHGVNRTIDGQRYLQGATITIRGLSEGVRTFVRARRMAIPSSDDIPTRYGKYCANTYEIVPSAPPGSVTLMAPGSVPTGHAMSLSWMHDGSATQTKWVVYRTSSNSSPTKTKYDSRLAEGNDARESCIIPWETISRAISSQSRAGGIYIYMAVTTSGGTTESEVARVEVVDPPVLEVFGPDGITAQGEAVSLACSLTPASVALVLTSLGSSGSGPEGDRTQVAGDVVWTDVITPAWMAYGSISRYQSMSSALINLRNAETALAQLSDDDDGYDTAKALVERRLAELAWSRRYNATSDTGSSIWYASLRLPDWLDLRDGATYVLTATATATRGSVELLSDVVETELAVSWARHAPTPPDTIHVDAYDETDEDGIREIGATMLLDEPQGMAAGDVYDVYRVRVDGIELIAESVTPGLVVRDRYAPYGEAVTYYRVACRTPDGDVEWADYEYRLDGDCARIDWGTTYVELPYDLAIDHRYAKDFEARHHVGQLLPEGYWGEGHDRSVTITADLVRALSAEDRRRLHELGSHAGPCLVRCADGSCFEAQVETSGMPVRHDSQAVAVSLACTEIAPTGTYSAAIEDPPEPEE